MKIFDFLVKIAIFETFEHLIWKVTYDTNLPKIGEMTPEMAILTKKSKIFIKAKLTVSKSYLLGLVYLMISCIIRDAHL